MRVEIDGTGTKPDFFLNDMEIVDLDTDERSHFHLSLFIFFNLNQSNNNLLS